jgi:hypothetical protein
MIFLFNCLLNKTKENEKIFLLAMITVGMATSCAQETTSKNQTAKS